MDRGDEQTIKTGDDMENEFKINEIIKYKRASYSTLPSAYVEKTVTKLQQKLEALNDNSLEKEYIEAFAWGATKSEIIQRLIQAKKDKYAEISDSEKFIKAMENYKGLLDGFSSTVLSEKCIKSLMEGE